MPMAKVISSCFSRSAFSESRLCLLATALGLLLSQGCAMLQPAITETPPQPAVQPPESAAKEKPAMKLKLPQTGKASWYGAAHQGKPTASGEKYDEGRFTAAHRSLPLGTKIKVTNLANGKSVEVEINDRGPFEEDRIIDLSAAAAKALEIKKSGTARVRLDLSSGP